MMRQLRFIFIALTTFIFVTSAVFIRRTVSILLCGLLSFNSASCYGFLDKYGKADAAEVKCTIAQGSDLNNETRKNVSEALKNEKNKRCIAYETFVKVGGSLAWRANNPGNLRNAPTKIATAPGAEGTFAVFATMADGRAAQRSLYLAKYGKMKVRDAVAKLTPPSENDTARYIKNLESQGINVDETVESQIDNLMTAIEANEGLIVGTEVPRSEDQSTAKQCLPKNQNKSDNKSEKNYCIEGLSTGDPHLVTFDGLRYDLQALGEFILIKSNDGAFQLQARHAPFSSAMSVNSAVAMKVGSNRVALYAREFPDADTSTPLRVNGKPTTIQGNKLTLPGGGEISQQGSTYVIISPRGEKVLVNPAGAGNTAFFNVSPFVYNQSGKYSGLLGNVNGNPNDDLQSRGGNNVLAFKSTYGDVNKVLNLIGLRAPGALDKAEKVYFDQLYKEFANSWRVKQEESLFDYPAGKTTQNYVDPNFPSQYLTLNMLSPDQIQKARNACTEAKVTQDLMEGCIFDVGFSGFSEFARATSEINGYVNIVNQLFPGLKIPTTGQFVDQTIQKVKPKVCFLGRCL